VQGKEKGLQEEGKKEVLLEGWVEVGVYKKKKKF